jgi:uncharacterized protein (TIGR00369 family)
LIRSGKESWRLGGLQDLGGGRKGSMNKDDEDSPLLAEPYPLQKLLGYRIAVWDHDLAEVRMALTALHANLHGIPHGGVYAVLIDTAAGFSGTYRGEGQPRARAMTLSLNINFVGLPEGNELIATGRKVGGGRNAFFSQVELRCSAGRLVATGQAALRYRKGDGNPVAPSG